MSTICTLEELCRACNVQADWVSELVEHGVLEPIDQKGSVWKFASFSIVRVAKAKRLERDLGLNPPGVALVFELLAEIDELHSRLKNFETSIEPSVQIEPDLSTEPNSKD